MTVRVGLVGGGWISRHHLEALERLGRTELVGVVAGRRTTSDAVAARWGGRAYDDVDAMLAGERPDVVVGGRAAAPVRGHRRTAGRGTRAVPDREAAGRRRRGWPGQAGGRDRRGGPGGRCRLPPEGARHHGRGSPPTGVRAGAAGRRPLAGFDARAGVVGPRGRRRRPGDRAGDPSLRPRAMARRGGGRRRGGLDPRSRCLAADGGRRRQHARRSCASPAERSARSPTRGGSPRPSSRSSSSRTACSRD